MISFEEAASSRFDASTLEELREYHVQHFGESPPPKMNGPTIRKRLLSALGLTQDFVAPVATEKKSPIFPTYNLSPNGKWGGRRHRIKVSRPPDATKNENVWVGSINGGPEYAIKYGEVQAVPEPIFLRIKGLQKPTPISKRIPQEDGSAEVTTELRLDERHSVNYIGPDEATKDLAGSLTEWYQRHGPDWFRKRSDRDLQLIAQRLEMVWQDEKKRPLPRAEIQDRLIEFFFGYAEATDEAA